MFDYEQLNRILENIAEQLEFNETRYDNMESKYQAIANWLDAESSPLAQNSPLIFPQGSVSLGTEVKPIGSDEYDVDLVCQLSRIARTTSPTEVKKRVGDRFKQHDEYAKKLVEKNRCWRIVYAGDFHLDVIPAIVDADQPTTAILVPDKLLHDWCPSDPKGYAAWFRGRMAVQFLQQKAALAEVSYKHIEEIPDRAVKTPLQRVVQLLKRHRDVQFGDDEDKPISIIITTLAAHSYGNQNNLYDALVAIVEDMNCHIEDRGGLDWISNPVNPVENFADKWQKHPERREAFFKWLSTLKAQLAELEQYHSLHQAEALLQVLFGEQVVSNAVKATTSRNRIAVQSRTRTPSIFDVPHRKIMPWPFHPQYRVIIEATIRGGVIGGVMPKPFYSNSTPLRKGYSLRYLAKTNVPKPYEVQWQVVNTGVEAERRGQMRGGFYKSSGSSNGNSYRTESTAYTGMHWVEAFVLKNGVCVARSGELVVHIA